MATRPYRTSYCPRRNSATTMPTRPWPPRWSCGTSSATWGAGRSQGVGTTVGADTHGTSYSGREESTDGGAGRVPQRLRRARRVLRNPQRPSQVGRGGLERAGGWVKGRILRAQDMGNFEVELEDGTHKTIVLPSAHVQQQPELSTTEWSDEDEGSDDEDYEPATCALHCCTSPAAFPLHTCLRACVRASCVQVRKFTETSISASLPGSFSLFLTCARASSLSSPFLSSQNSLLPSSLSSSFREICSEQHGQCLSISSPHKATGRPRRTPRPMGFRRPKPRRKAHWPISLSVTIQSSLHWVVW